MSLEDFSIDLYTKCGEDNEALEREITKLLKGEHEEVPVVDNSILATLLRYNILSTKILSLILTKCPDSLEGTNGGYTALQILASQYYKTMKDLSKPSFTAQQRQELFSQAQTLLANIHYLVSNGANPSPKIKNFVSDTELPCNPIHIAALLDDRRLMEVLMASSKLNLEQSTGHLNSESQMLCLNFPLLCAIHNSQSVFAYTQGRIKAEALNTIAIYGRTALHVAVINFLNNRTDEFRHYDYESKRMETVTDISKLPLASHMVIRLIAVNSGLILSKDSANQDIFDYILSVLNTDTDIKNAHIKMLFAYCLQQIDDSAKADIFIRIKNKINHSISEEAQKALYNLYEYLWNHQTAEFKSSNTELAPEKLTHSLEIEARLALLPNDSDTRSNNQEIAAAALTSAQRQFLVKKGETDLDDKSEKKERQKKHTSIRSKL